jgi:hypothetical protein
MLPHLLFTKKLSKSSSKYDLGIREQGSEIRDPEKKTIPDPRARNQGSKRHRIPKPDPGSGSATLDIIKADKSRSNW